MTKTGLTTLAAILALASLAAPAAAQQSASTQREAGNGAAAGAARGPKLALLIADDARRDERLDPLSALYQGGDVDAKLLQQLFTDGLERRELASARQTLRALKRIERSRLSPERQISYDVLTYNKREAARWAAARYPRAQIGAPVQPFRRAAR